VFRAYSWSAFQVDGFASKVMSYVKSALPPDVRRWLRPAVAVPFTASCPLSASRRREANSAAKPKMAATTTFRQSSGRLKSDYTIVQKT
jgi:hypothetical protein